MIGKIAIAGMWILFVLGAALMAFGIVGVSVPIGSEGSLPIPFIVLNILGGLMVMGLAILGECMLNGYEVD